MASPSPSPRLLSFPPSPTLFVFGNGVPVVPVFHRRWLRLAAAALWLLELGSSLVLPCLGVLFSDFGGGGVKLGFTRFLSGGGSVRRSP
jgi:hypothetical protein